MATERHSLKNIALLFICLVIYNFEIKYCHIKLYFPSLFAVSWANQT